MAVESQSPADLAPGGTVQRSTGQVRQRVGQVRQRVEAARPGNRTLDAALHAVARDAETGGGVLAAAVAFRVFLFMVPYAFVVVTGLGFADDAVNGAPGELARRAGVA
jgi:hypothetical protein